MSKNSTPQAGERTHPKLSPELTALERATMYAASLSQHGSSSDRENLMRHMEANWPHVSAALVTACQRLWDGPVPVAMVTHPATGNILKPWMLDGAESQAIGAAPAQSAGTVWPTTPVDCQHPTHGAMLFLATAADGAIWWLHSTGAENSSTTPDCILRQRTPGAKPKQYGFEEDASVPSSVVAAARRKQAMGIQLPPKSTERATRAQAKGGVK